MVHFIWIVDRPVRERHPSRLGVVLTRVESHSAQELKMHTPSPRMAKINRGACMHAHVAFSLFTTVQILSLSLSLLERGICIGSPQQSAYTFHVLPRALKLSCAARGNEEDTFLILLSDALSIFFANIYESFCKIITLDN